MKQLRIGIVGCGAVTDLAHLPALALVAGVRPTVLVDRNIDRATGLAKKYNVPHAFDNIDVMQEHADAVILAVPHALHASLGVKLLEKGLHVLVEKPMALTACECDSMIAAATENNVALAVGLMRRFTPWARLTKWILQSGWIGRVLSFEYREGYVYSWPVASDFMFRKDAAGGGVLIDTGAHTLDSVLWWLGDVDQFEYADDAEGGVEANCELRLAMASGATGYVELSRNRNLGGRATIRGEMATLEVHSGQVKLIADGTVWAGGPTSLTSLPTSNEYLASITASINDWIDAIRTNRAPTVSGAEGRKSVALIEACYATRRPLTYPWLATGLDLYAEANS